MLQTSGAVNDYLGVAMTYPTKDHVRFWSKVDKTGECWNWTSPLTPKGYGWFITCTAGKPRRHGSHRFAYEIAVGPIPAGHYVDHKCHNHACVNPAHLRPLTPKQNNEHRKGPQANSTTGLLGVHFYKRTGKWTAYVTHAGKRTHLGYFATADEAASVAAAKRNELFTHNDRDRVAV